MLQKNPIASGQDQAAIPRARARRSGVQPPGARPGPGRRVPALERLRFLCILSSNLDEFFEIRVAELKERIRLGNEIVIPERHLRRRFSPW